MRLPLSIVSRRFLKHGKFAFIDDYNRSAKPFRWTYDGRPSKQREDMNVICAREHQ